MYRARASFISNARSKKNTWLFEFSQRHFQIRSALGVCWIKDWKKHLEKNGFQGINGHDRARGRAIQTLCARQARMRFFQTSALRYEARSSRLGIFLNTTWKTKIVHTVFPTLVLVSQTLFSLRWVMKSSENSYLIFSTLWIAPSRHTTFVKSIKSLLWLK